MPLPWPISNRSQNRRASAGPRNAYQWSLHDLEAVKTGREAIGGRAPWSSGRCRETWPDETFSSNRLPDINIRKARTALRSRKVVELASYRPPKPHQRVHGLASAVYHRVMRGCWRLGKIINVWLDDAANLTAGQLSRRLRREQRAARHAGTSSAPCAVAWRQITISAGQTRGCRAGSIPI